MSISSPMPSTISSAGTTTAAHSRMKSQAWRPKTRERVPEQRSHVALLPELELIHAAAPASSR